MGTQSPAPYRVPGDPGLGRQRLTVLCPLCGSPQLPGGLWGDKQIGTLCLSPHSLDYKQKLIHSHLMIQTHHLDSSCALLGIAFGSRAGSFPRPLRGQEPGALSVSPCSLACLIFPGRQQGVGCQHHQRQLIPQLRVAPQVFCLNCGCHSCLSCSCCISP